MLAGDSAMMCLNLGYMVRGMDYAIAAGQIAGQSAARAIDAGDTSASEMCIRDRVRSASRITWPS